MFFVRDLGEIERNPDSRRVAAWLRFEGDPSGSLTLRVGMAAARSIAADFLGEEAAMLSDVQVEEVICELANMICGSVLSRVESTATFRLDSPTVISPLEEAPEDASNLSCGPKATYRNGSLIARIQTEEPACPIPEEFAY